MKLQLSDELSLPLDGVTQKFAILGRTGSGKSYGATKLCEEMLDAKAQVVALDPVGVWYGLRVGTLEVDDKAPPGYSIPVFGGLHGDIPLEAGAGALMADLIVERNLSAVLDLSSFLLAEQRRFATDFATQLFHRKKTQRSAVHVFFEEAQEFVPQQVRGDVAKMVGAFERLIKLGRNFGIGATLISQRPQAVNKDVLNQTECLIAFQMTGPQERKTIETWIAEKGVNEDIATVLPHLKVGQCHIWSPQWLGISRTVKIAAKRTADVSSTPKPGVKPIQPRELSPVDLAELREKMSATIERAKAEDPRELRRLLNAERAEAQRLKAQLEKGHTEIKTREVPVLSEGFLKRIEKFADKAWDSGSSVCAAVKDLREALSKVSAQAQSVHFANFRKTENSRPQMVQAARPTATRDVARSSRHQPSASAGELKISRTQQRILDALAWFESIRIPQPTALQVGAIALIDATGGHFSNTVGPLSSSGLIVRGNGTLALTDAGRAVAQLPEQVATLAEYHDVLRERVRRSRSGSGKTVEILNAVIRRGGGDVTIEEIGAEVGIDHTGGHFSNTIGPLSTLGFIKRNRGTVSPTDIVFPPGLA